MQCSLGAAQHGMTVSQICCCVSLKTAADVVAVSCSSSIVSALAKQHTVCRIGFGYVAVAEECGRYCDVAAACYWLSTHAVSVAVPAGSVTPQCCATGIVGGLKWQSTFQFRMGGHCGTGKQLTCSLFIRAFDACCACVTDLVIQLSV